MDFIKVCVWLEEKKDGETVKDVNQKFHAF